MKPGPASWMLKDAAWVGRPHPSFQPFSSRAVRGAEPTAATAGVAERRGCGLPRAV